MGRNNLLLLLKTISIYSGLGCIKKEWSPYFHRNTAFSSSQQEAVTQGLTH
jgi:hypothetical protein